jgi:hypothetical protein
MLVLAFSGSYCLEKYEYDYSNKPKSKNSKNGYNPKRFYLDKWRFGTKQAIKRT